MDSSDFSVDNPLAKGVNCPEKINKPKNNPRNLERIIQKE
jgi:hypothetical protein